MKVNLIRKKKSNKKHIPQKGVKHPNQPNDTNGSKVVEVRYLVGNSFMKARMVHPVWIFLFMVCVVTMFSSRNSLPSVPKRTSFGYVWEVSMRRVKKKTVVHSNKQMGVSKKIRGTPKLSILIGFSIINHPFWGTRIFGNTPINEMLPLQELIGCLFQHIFSVDTTNPFVDD